MHCPTCHESLIELTYEGICIRSCNGCGGEFLSPSDIGHIIRTRDEWLPAAPPACTPIFGVPAEETKRVLDCPACQTTMNVTNYGGDTGVFVDACPECGGLWLDHHELEQVQMLTETWSDRAPEQMQGIAAQLVQTREDAMKATKANFADSRFGFVNALLSKLLDVAA